MKLVTSLVCTASLVRSASSLSALREHAGWQTLPPAHRCPRLKDQRRRRPGVQTSSRRLWFASSGEAGTDEMPREFGVFARRCAVDVLELVALEVGRKRRDMARSGPWRCDGPAAQSCVDSVATHEPTPNRRTALAQRRRGPCSLYSMPAMLGVELHETGMARRLAAQRRRHRFRKGYLATGCPSCTPGTLHRMPPPWAVQSVMDPSLVA